MVTYLITGANRGIGYEYCRQLNKRGDPAIAACRTAAILLLSSFSSFNFLCSSTFCPTLNAIESQELYSRSSFRG